MKRIKHLIVIAFVMLFGCFVFFGCSSNKNSTKLDRDIYKWQVTVDVNGGEIETSSLHRYYVKDGAVLPRPNKESSVIKNPVFPRKTFLGWYEVAPENCDEKGVPYRYATIDGEKFLVDTDIRGSHAFRFVLDDNGNKLNKGTDENPRYVVAKLSSASDLVYYNAPLTSDGTVSKIDVKDELVYYIMADDFADYYHKCDKAGNILAGEEDKYYNFNQFEVIFDRDAHGNIVESNGHKVVKYYVDNLGNPVLYRESSDEKDSDYAGYFFRVNVNGNGDVVENEQGTIYAETYPRQSDEYGNLSEAKPIYHNVLQFEVVYESKVFKFFDKAGNEVDYIEESVYTLGEPNISDVEFNFETTKIRRNYTIAAKWTTTTRFVVATEKDESTETSRKWTTAASSFRSCSNVGNDEVIYDTNLGNANIKGKSLIGYCLSPDVGIDTLITSWPLVYKDGKISSMDGKFVWDNPVVDNDTIIVYPWYKTGKWAKAVTEASAFAEAIASNQGVVLINDIDFKISGDSGVSYSKYSVPNIYTGTIEGNGHVVKNIHAYLTQSVVSSAKANNYYGGLFKSLEEATIKDITFEDVVVAFEISVDPNSDKFGSSQPTPVLKEKNSNAYVNLLAGSISKSTISNVKINGSISVTRTLLEKFKLDDEGHVMKDDKGQAIKETYPVDYDVTVWYHDSEIVCLDDAKVDSIVTDFSCTFVAVEGDDVARKVADNET